MHIGLANQRVALSSASMGDGRTAHFRGRAGPHSAAAAAPPPGPPRLRQLRPHIFHKARLAQNLPPQCFPRRRAFDSLGHKAAVSALLFMRSAPHCARIQSVQSRPGGPHGIQLWRDSSFRDTPAQNEPCLRGRIIPAPRSDTTPAGNYPARPGSLCMRPARDVNTTMPSVVPLGIHAVELWAPSDKLPSGVSITRW